jgi:hypothetical protein
MEFGDMEEIVVTLLQERYKSVAMVILISAFMAAIGQLYKDKKRFDLM